MSYTRILVSVIVLGAAAIVGYNYYSATARGSGDELAINLGNNTYVPLTKFDYAPAGSGNFSTASMTEPLGAGNFFDLVIPGGKTQCHYDLRITNDKGEISDRSDVDLCAATYYHVEPE